jgi:iron(III) transport system substrate-binding protein
MQSSRPNGCRSAASRIDERSSTPNAIATIGRRHLLRIGASSAVALGTGRALADVPPDATLLSAARQEGTLTVYTPAEMGMMARWCASFTHKFAVQVKIVRGPSYPMFDRWLNEERVGRRFADVVQISDSTLLSMAFKQGFVAHYRPAADEAMYPDMKQSGVWYALHADYMGIAYNSERTTAQDEKFLHENGWDALTDPRWKGRCATVEPRRAEAHMLTTTCSWSG